MIIEVILIILGALTGALGIWNMIVGAYVWGALFLIGGIWSVWLGILYIIQDRKAKAKEKAVNSVINSHTTAETAASVAVDDRILTQDLFATGYEESQPVQSETAVLDDMIEQTQAYTQIGYPMGSAGEPVGSNTQNLYPAAKDFYNPSQNGAANTSSESTAREINVLPNTESTSYLDTYNIQGTGFGPQSSPEPLDSKEQSLDSQTSEISEPTVVLEEVSPSVASDTSETESSDSKVSEQISIAHSDESFNQPSEFTETVEASLDEILPESGEISVTQTSQSENAEIQLVSDNAVEIQSMDASLGSSTSEEKTKPLETVSVEQETSSNDGRSRTNVPNFRSKTPIFLTETLKKAKDSQPSLEEGSSDNTVIGLEASEVSEQEAATKPTETVDDSSRNKAQEEDQPSAENSGEVIFLGGEISSPEDDSAQ